MPYMIRGGESYYGIEMDNDYWNPEWGHKYDCMQPMGAGERIDAKYIPTRGHIIKSAGKIFPPLIGHPAWFCMEEVKNTIEGLEPGIHQFQPFELRKSKKGPVVAEYYYMNICDAIDTVDVERSDPNVIQKQDYRTRDGREAFHLNYPYQNVRGGGYRIA